MMSNSVNMMKRAPNFTEAEELMLVRIVKKHKGIIECKKTDSIQNR